MKITETNEELEIVKYTKTIRVECDKCGTVIPPEGRFEQRETKIEFAHGNIYPEGGVLHGWRVEDMCDGCMKWLRETLEENGVRISKLEIDL